MDTTRTFNTELMEVIELGNLHRMLRGDGGGGAGAQREPWRPLPRATIEQPRRRQLPAAHAGLSVPTGRAQPELRYKPVVITEFQPKERKY